MSAVEMSGLYETGTGALCCALKSVKAHTSITQGQAVTRVTQQYRNDTAGPLETVYRFPIPHDAVVTRFEAAIGDASVEGRLCEEGEARRRYEEAKRAGDSAMLLERRGEDIFDISVGAVAPGEDAAVTIEYWQELKAVDGRCRYALPTALAPRYLPAESRHKAKDVLPHIGEADYRLDFTADIDMGGCCRGVASPSHAVEVREEGEGRLTVSLKAPTLLDGDLILDIAFVDPGADVCVAEEGPDGNFLWVKFQTGQEEEPQAAANREYVFLLDASGSMQGGKLEQAKRALSLCLRNLMRGDRFFLVAFGSDYRCFSESSVEYGQAALDGADAWLKTMGTLGGTEIYAPLLHVYSLKDCGLRREILLFTDGQVGNEQQIVSLVGSNRGSARFFPFGIDTAVNRAFIESLAQAGGGLPEYIYPGERIDDKVIRQFARIASPSVRDVAMEGLGAAGAVNLRNAAASTAFPETLYFGEEYSLCFNLGFRPIPERVVISGLAGGKPYRREIALGQKIGWQGLSKRWARETVAMLEERSERESGADRNARVREIVDVSMQYGVISRHTAYVAYISRKDKLTGKINTAAVPSALPSLWEDEPEMCYAAAFTGSAPTVRLAAAPLMSGMFAPRASAMFMPPPAAAAPQAGDRFALAAMQAALMQRADGSFGAGPGAVRAASRFLIGMLLGGEYGLMRNQLIKAVRFLLSGGVGADALWAAVAVRMAMEKGLAGGKECTEFIRKCAAGFGAAEKKLFEDAKAGRWQAVFAGENLVSLDDRAVAIHLLRTL